MVDRPIIYDQAQGRPYDVLWGWREALRALATQMQDTLGGSAAVVSGLNASATGPTSLSVNVGGGRIYQLAQTDAMAYGSLTADTRTVMQQGEWSAAAVALVTTGLSSGKSRWALIQAQFTQSDIIPGDDPNGGLLPFLNASNPSGPPWSGPANAGTTLPTRRSGVCTISVIYGSVANTGTEVPPSASAGCVGLYLIDLAFGQTTINSGQILVAGPSVGVNVPSNYPVAPFLAGLLSSHHNGNPGQAPQINLATETQGILPASALTGLLGNFSEFKAIVDANYEIVASDWGGYVALGAPTANRTFTVDDGAGPAVIRATNLSNSTQTLTMQIKTGSSALFFGQPTSILGGVTSFTMNGGDEVQMVWTGSNWHVIRFTNTLANLTALTFGSANGVLKLPNFQNLNAPLTLQWGTGTFPNSGTSKSTQAITFNQNFLNQCNFYGGNCRGTTGSGVWMPSFGTTSAPALNGATFQGDLLGAGVFNSLVPFFWFAIGN